jgi:hypothetical protein
MSVGYAADKGSIDSRAGNLAQVLRDNFTNIQSFQKWLLATPDANFTALGYTTQEIATLKSAYVDLNKLATIYLGTATQATAYDFTQFAKLLVGVF